MIRTVRVAVFAFPWIAMAAMGVWHFSASMTEIKRGLAPVSDWLSVKEMHVYDSWAGEPPYLSVNRAIKRPFYGEWLATVRRASDGTLAFACIAEGRASYATDARLPLDMTLDWWTFPTKCRLEPGRYRLDTEWRISPPDHPQKQLRVQSNIFEVHPHWRDYRP